MKYILLREHNMFDMKTFHRPVLILLLLHFFNFSSFCQDWREKMEDLVYTPRYFGPNAFPIPELREGRVSESIEVEVRGEYHSYTGDKTKDLYSRILFPFVRGRAAVEISWVIYEHYKYTPETRDERNAAELTSLIRYNGDVIISSLFQLLKSDKWLDILVSANLKTASGGRLCDARFTDAASYWFDANLSKELWRDPSKKASIRVQGLMGFYCWMTNDAIYRQNDAITFGIGFSGYYQGFSLRSDFSGFKGYLDQGDIPLILRNVLQYEFRKNRIGLRYDHGMKDRLYESYGLSYTRLF